MELKQAYLQHVEAEVGELASRVDLLKTRLARQKVGVKLQHNSELEYVRNRFEEFKRRVEELEEASDDQIEDARQASEAAWKDLQYAVDALLTALP